MERRRGNIMKQKCSIFLIIALLSGLVTSVHAAENTLTAQYRYDGLQDAIIVEGTVRGEKGNIFLTLDVTGPDGNFLLGQQTKGKADNFQTVFPYIFAPVNFGTNFASGTYTLEVSGYQIAEPVILTFEYSGVDILFEAMQKVNTAVAQGGADNVLNTIRDNAEQLGVSREEMLALGSNGKTVFIQLMTNAKCDIPADINTDANREKVKDAALLFRKAFTDAAAVGKYCDIETTEDLKAWLTAYTAQYGLAEDDINTAVNEAQLFAYVEKMENETAFAARAAKRSHPGTIKAVRDALYEDALLTMIEKCHYSETKAVIDEFPELFPVNRTRFSQLNSTKQGQVYERVNGKFYADYAAVAAAFDKAVDDLLGSGGNGGGSSSTGGNSGKWGSEGASGTGVITSPPDNTQTGNPGFRDLDTVPWAKEAILFLEGKNVVSGKAAGIFSPDDPVTRAEFTKMIVTAAGVELRDGDAGFADVTEGDWYFPYVSAARRAGLVMGDEENNFNPNAQITRQDMAVILYRAYNIQIKGAETDFADQEEISSYAADAVGYFYTAGIVSGMGGGRFAPKDNATRAQAAVMLYNVMTKL